MSKLPKTWTTNDGRVLAIKEMESRHIENCIRMMERNNFTTNRDAEIFSA